MSPLKVLVVFGTRPEAIKLAPIVLAMRRHPGIDPVVVVTGQHRAMLDQVLHLFGLVPDVDLDIARPGQSLSGIVGRTLHGLDSLLTGTRPDVVMVQGDTATTFAAALAAFFHRVPVVHVEAGLRTGDPASPFPEEMNRILTTRLSTLHLAATRDNADNLRAEGVRWSDIVCTGNSVIDALLTTVGGRDVPDHEVLHAVLRHRGPVVLVTTHRRESWGAPMAAVAQAVAELAERRPDVLFVVPMHLNPLVRDVLVPALSPLPSVLLAEPLDYAVFCRVLQRADVVLSDSGGVQEEGPSLGTPVLVLRETTERPEAVAAGAARLVGTDRATIVRTVEQLLDDPAEYLAMARAVNPYGDGRAAERTVAAVLHAFGEGRRPEDFRWDEVVGPPRDAERDDRELDRVQRV